MLCVACFALKLQIEKKPRRTASSSKFKILGSVRQSPAAPRDTPATRARLTSLGLAPQPVSLHVGSSVPETDDLNLTHVTLGCI